MNQFYRIYSKEDLMKRIVLLLAVGLIFWTGSSFGENPNIAIITDKTEWASPELYRYRERVRHWKTNWELAEKIGMYEVELSSDILALYEQDHPSRAEFGKEYWFPCYRAKIESIENSDTCLICFESGDIFYLTGYPTEGFYSGKFIVLTSPVLCSRIHSDGTRILRFVPKEELSQRVKEGELFDKNQLAALKYAGYQEWQYKDGKAFWAKYESVSKGEIHFIDTMGDPLTLKPGQLSSAVYKFYNQELRRTKVKERQEKISPKTLLLFQNVP